MSSFIPSSWLSSFLGGGPIDESVAFTTATGEAASQLEASGKSILERLKEHEADMRKKLLETKKEARQILPLPGNEIVPIHPHSIGVNNGNRQANSQVYRGPTGVSGPPGQQSAASGAQQNHAAAQAAYANALGNIGHMFQGYNFFPLPPGFYSIDESEQAAKEPLKHTSTVFGEIIGWRMWRLSHGFLRSYSADRVWAPGEPMTGKPGDHKSDGIWAFKEKSRALHKAMDTATGSISHDTAVVYGSVRLYGLIVEHELGYRAEYAEIASLEEMVCLSADPAERYNTIAMLQQKYLDSAKRIPPDAA